MTTTSRLDQSRVLVQQTQQLQRQARVERQVQPRQAIGDGFDRQRQARVGEEAQAAAQNTGRPRLDSIANATLVPGRAHTCVTTVRRNLNRLGLEGVPSSTGQDPNNPRGMMVQMLQSGQWDSLNVPGSERRSIESPYGTVEANVMTREQYEQAVADGTIPNGAVVFQTRHGWDFDGGSRGNDVGILQNGRLFNSNRMAGPLAYGENTRDIVVMLPRE
jgi:hypothetical protein